jgi:hypothetical protein
MFDSFPLCFSYVIVGISFVETNGLWLDVFGTLFLQRAMCTDALLFSPISRHLSSTIDVLLQLVSPGPFYPCPFYPLTCSLISVYRLLSRDYVCVLNWSCSTMTLADYHCFGRSLHSYDQGNVCFGRLHRKKVNLRGMRDVARTLCCQKVSLRGLRAD